MVSKGGNTSFIRGRIQGAFKQWHIEREIDLLLLGGDLDQDLIPEWEEQTEDEQS